MFGMFHLFTHAFFKALLFLGAGSVMHAHGGRGRHAALQRPAADHARSPSGRFLSVAWRWPGVLPFAGFWSKDGILATVFERGQAGGTSNVFGIAGLNEGVVLSDAVIGSALVTALLTAFYTFRAFFMTFFGPERIPDEAGHHAHESPRTMTVPLMILAVCATVVGFRAAVRASAISCGSRRRWPGTMVPGWPERGMH